MVVVMVFMGMETGVAVEWLGCEKRSAGAVLRRGFGGSFLRVEGGDAWGRRRLRGSAGEEMMVWVVGAKRAAGAGTGRWDGRGEVVPSREEEGEEREGATEEGGAAAVVAAGAGAGGGRAPRAIGGVFLVVSPFNKSFHFLSAFLMPVSGLPASLMVGRGCCSSSGGGGGDGSSDVYRLSIRLMV